METKKTYYFDYSATTPLRPEALAAMLPYLEDHFGNPSSLYGQARAARKAVEHARRQIAEALNAQLEEIFFTGGGTEADNWAVKGVAEAMKAKGRHIVTTAVEHHAVLYAAKYLQKNDYDVTFVPVDDEGYVAPADVEQALRPDTVLVSVMLANNEVGGVQPLADIAAITRARRIALHTDAVQAVGHIPVDVNALGVDLLTLSAHKFYGPKGVGALYIRSGTPITPLLHGGAQEGKRRAGTENVAGIVGMGEALALAARDMPEESARLAALRDRLLAGLEAAIPHVRLNGARTRPRLPGTVNMSFAFVEGESLLLLLDMQNCAASTGSACNSNLLEASHVLTAMRVPHELANCALRFSLGRHNTEADIARLLEVLPPIVQKLRDMSPIYDDFKKKGVNPWNTARK